jgi:uncharacterized protein (DUF2062 family)
MTSLRALVRRCEAALNTAVESPRRAAAAFAVGVGLSFSPLLGLQIALAALVAWIWKLNRVLLFVGLCTNLPWFMAPYYAATTAAAAWIMGAATPGALAAQFAELFAHSVLSTAFWRGVLASLWPLFWPFVLGSTVAATVLGTSAYFAGLAVATARRTRHANA